LQRVILLDRADQHDLHVDIHRLGLQRNRHQRAGHGRAAFLDLQAAAAQKAAQPLPQALVAEQVAQVQQQKAAVRLQQAARADVGKVGHQHFRLGLVLDAAKQAAQLRVVFDDHGRAAAACVVHGKVHAAAREQVFERGLALFLAAAGFGARLRWLEKVELVQQLAFYLIEPAAELHGVLDLLLEVAADVLQVALQQRRDGLAPQFHERLVARLLERAHGVEKARDLGAQLLLGGLDRGAALARQGVGFFFGERLAARAQQREHHAPVLAREAKVPRLGKRIERGKSLRLLRVPVAFDALHLSLVVGRREAFGDFALQRLGQLGHGLAQLPPLARGRRSARGCSGASKSCR
jgi:hypothetical protein